MVEQKLCVTLGSSTNLGVFCVLPSTKNLASPCATCFPWRKNDLRSWCFWYKKSCHDYSVGGPSVFWRWWGIQHQDQIIVFAEICIGMWNCCFIATREKKTATFFRAFSVSGNGPPPAEYDTNRALDSCSIGWGIGASFPQTFKTD